MRDTIINAKREREVNVNSTLFKVSALIYDMIGGNVDAINPLKLLELYQDITAIMNEITAGRLTMEVTNSSSPIRGYKDGKFIGTEITEETQQVKSPAERAAEVFEKKKRGRPRKNPAPET